MVEIADTIAHLRGLDEARRARGEARHRDLEGRLPRAREILRQHGADAIFLFGSLARGDTTAGSDLDLAVRGLRPEAYFTALGELMSHLRCDVDLVRLEDAPESLRRRVAEEGRRL